MEDSPSADQSSSGLMTGYFLDGGGSALARDAIFGFILLETKLDGDREIKLPLSRASLTGFLKVSPRHSKDGWPIEILWDLALDLLGRGETLYIAAVVLGTDGDFRPCGLMELKVGDVSKPAPRT